jgi:hypothetical protein
MTSRKGPIALQPFKDPIGMLDRILSVKALDRRKKHSLILTVDDSGSPFLYDGVAANRHAARWRIRVG